MARKKSGICKFEGCDHEVAHAPLGVCFRCYRYLLVWRDRSPAAKRDRHEQLTSLKARMEYMMVASAAEMPRKMKKKPRSKSNGNNVVPFPKEKAE